MRGFEDYNTKPFIKFFDLDKKEEKTVLNDAGYFTLSYDKQKMLVSSSGRSTVFRPVHPRKA